MSVHDGPGLNMGATEKEAQSDGFGPVAEGEQPVAERPPSGEPVAGENLQTAQGDLQINAPGNGRSPEPGQVKAGDFGPVAQSGGPVAEAERPTDVRAWWAAQVESHLGPIYRFVRARVPAGVADDLVQEVFVAAAGNLGGYNPARGSFWQWLLGIARNVVAGYYRRAAAENPVGRLAASLDQDGGALRDALVSESPLPDALCQREEFGALVRAALSTLDPKHQASLVGRYYQDLSLEELATSLDLSRAAVNSLLHRARRELRDELLRLLGSRSAAEESLR